jgi:cbb3-type cytochrome oxidase maturation protein
LTARRNGVKWFGVEYWVFMPIPSAVVLVITVAAGGAALALAGFVWAVRHGQLDPSNSDANVIFDDEERPQ